MDRDTKRTSEEVGRWLRVGLLTLTTLGPIINSIASQLRQRAEVAREEARRRSSVAATDGQERLLAVGASLADALVELKDHPYSQEIIRRGGDLSGTLSEQSGRISRVLAEQSGTLLERGSKVTQAIAERGSEVVSDLTERGSQVSQEVAKRSKKVSKEVTKRSHAVTESVSERNGTFWSILGFSLGLSAALVAIYLLIRKRVQGESLESQSFQIVQNGHLNGTVRQQPNAAAVGAQASQTSTKAPQSPAVPSAQPTQPVQPSIAVVEPSISSPSPQKLEPESAAPSPTLQQAPIVAQPPATEDEQEEETQKMPALTGAEKPLDAQFLGLVSNKYYYPIETPLDQLPTTAGEPIDVIYFASEEEAQAQGFSAAE